ncbi:calponin homology domain-containing protein DDB_G0272472-like isoform X3 [Symsagittifera roscoffensis]|uniref:calponin homology domain-containing protein DDB_G0272472-like isoform X3 n=1 Tax=Symsagittifera roscoffensis TaxID=84072 RepID=UPI00307C1BCF
MKEPPSVNLGQGLLLASNNGQLQIMLPSGIAPRGARGKVVQPPVKKKPVVKQVDTEKAEDIKNTQAKPKTVAKPVATRMKNNAENNEETVTLTKKQLDALVGTINEVCNLAAEEMDSMRLLKDTRDNLAVEAEESISARIRQTNAELNREPTPEKRDKQKKLPSHPEESKPIQKSLPAKGKPKGGENIMDLLGKGDKKPVSKKPGTNSKDKKMTASQKKFADPERIERMHSTVSKALSPIIVYEQTKPSRPGQKPNRPEKDRGRDRNKRDRSPMKKASPVPERTKKTAAVNTTVEHETSELNVTNFSATSSDLPVNHSAQVTDRKEEVSQENSPKSDSSKENKKVEIEKPKPPLTLMEKKRLQWEEQKRENSTLRKETIVAEIPKKQPISHSPPPAPKHEQNNRETRKGRDQKENKGGTEDANGGMDRLRVMSSSPKVLSPRHVMNQPSAMLDHFQVVSENDLAVTKKYQQQQWLKELEKQKEEQRLKKMIEDELRRSFIDVTPRRATTILAEVYDEASKITEQDQNSNNFQPDNPLAAYVPNRNRLQLELKMKKLIQNRIATHFPQNNQVSITNQMSNSSQVSPVKQTQNRYPAGGDEVDGANQLSGKEMKPSVEVAADPWMNKHPNATASLRGGGGGMGGNELRESVNETGQTAYNSSQTHLVFHQAFEEPVQLTDRPSGREKRNEFGRFKALIDPAEAERQRNKREKQQEHVKEVQRQIEAKRLAKEEEKRKQKQEEYEDEQRVRRELNLATDSGPSEYNRTRPVPKAQLEPPQNEYVQQHGQVEAAPEVQKATHYVDTNHNHSRLQQTQRNRETQNVANRRVAPGDFTGPGSNVVHSPIDSSAYHLDPHQYQGRGGGGGAGNMGMISTGANIVQRQDSDVVVEYVPQHEIGAQMNTNRNINDGRQQHNESALASSRYVEQEVRSHQAKQSGRRANERDIRRPENLRQKKKETLNRHNRQFGAVATDQQSTVSGMTSSRKPLYKQNEAVLRSNRSPPVPALQKRTMDKPSIPSQNKRAPSNATTHVNEQNYHNTTIPETGRTQQTVMSSRYVDPNVTSPPPVANGDFIPFRRTSAHMDPAINSSRRQQPPNHHQSSTNQRGSQQQHHHHQRRAPPSEFSLDEPVQQRNTTGSAIERHDAVLKQLSSLRQGLIEKQREYNNQTPTQYDG